MYKIVFLDIDGTILDHEKTIRPLTKLAVQKLKETGIEVVIATGRAPFITHSIANELGIESVVYCNGAYIGYKGTIIDKKAMNVDDLQLLSQVAQENGHLATYINESAFSPNVPDHPHLEKHYAHSIEGIPVFDETFLSREVYTAHLHCPESHIHIYKERVPNLEFMYWANGVSLDVSQKGVSKREGIRAMLDYLGIHPSEAVAFGDGSNDFEMLDFVGMGVAMGNASDELKLAANYVTTSVDEDGIYHGLKALKLID